MLNASQIKGLNPEGGSLVLNITATKEGRLSVLVNPQCPEKPAPNLSGAAGAISRPGPGGAWTVLRHAGGKVLIRIFLKRREGFFVLNVGREQLLKGEEIEVIPKDDLLKGTTVVIEGEFDVDKTVAEVKEQIRYHTLNPSGECMAFTLQGEPLPQKDFLAEGVHGKVWIREVTAGTVAISSGGYCIYDTKGNMNVLFHGQTLLCPLKGRLAEVPEYRLRVKGLGLTPRLPDRTDFIEDSRLAVFMEEFKAVVREGLLSGEIRATADLVKTYLGDRLDIFLPEVGPFGIDYDLICLPAYPHGAADMKRALIPDKGEEWNGKEFEVIIDSSFSDLPGEGFEILAALHYLNQSGAVKVGVMHNSAAISRCCLLFLASSTLYPVPVRHR